MAYNTNNPLGSNDFKDLSDNAVNFDYFANGSQPAYPNRLGQLKLSIEGMLQQFQAAQVGRAAQFETFVASLGFVWIGDYGAGLTFTTRSQYMVRAGEQYALADSTTLPYTTTGDWAAEVSKFKLLDPDSTLRQDLASSVAGSGAALLGRGAQFVGTNTQLRQLLKTSPSTTAMVLYSGAIYTLDTSDTTTPDDGGSVLVASDGGRWKFAYNRSVTPRMFGAVGDGAADDIVPLEKMIAYFRTKSGGVCDLDGGLYGVSRPLKLLDKFTIGGRGFILALSGFTSTVSYPTYGTEVPQIYDCLVYFNDGTHADEPNNFGWNKIIIEEGVTLYGADRVANGIITEGLTNYRFSATFSGFTAIGVWLKYYCWGGCINGYIENCATAFFKLGPAANGIDLNGLRCFGSTKTPTYGAIIDGDNNGINFSGAFFEKTVNGIYWVNGSGPTSISGIDFEICSNTLIKIDGTGVAGRPIGPVVITGSFLEATACIVDATNAIVIVNGCRIRNTALAFKSSGNFGRIYEVANVIEASVTKIAQGAVVSDRVNNSSRSMITQVAHGETEQTVGTSLENKHYYFDDSIITSGMSYSSGNADPATQRTLTQATWYTREMRAGSIYQSLGTTLDLSAGAKNFGPIEDATHSCGYAAKRWATVFASSGTINTSDARLKTEVSKFSPGEIAAAKALSAEIGTYRWLDAVAEKGDAARKHIGMTVQRAMEIMVANGLDPMAYGFICFDKWDARDAILDSEGTTVVEAIKAGDLYSFRYDALNLFLAAGLEARLIALENK